MQGLKNTDARVLADKPVTPTFLFALLLYGPIAGIIEATPPERWHEMATILDACDRAIREAQTRIAIPKRFSLGVREMFALQPRLEHPARPARVAGAGTSALSCRLRPAGAACGVRSRAAGDGTVVDAPAGGVGRGARPHGRRARRCDACSTRAAAPHPQPPPPLRSLPGRPDAGPCRSGSPPTSAWAATLPIRHSRCARRSSAWRICRARGALRVSPPLWLAPVRSGRAAGFRQRCRGPADPALIAASCWTQLRALETAFGRPRRAAALGTAGARPGSAVVRLRSSAPTPT